MNEVKLKHIPSLVPILADMGLSVSPMPQLVTTDAGDPAGIVIDIVGNGSNICEWVRGGRSGVINLDTCTLEFTTNDRNATNPFRVVIYYDLVISNFNMKQGTPAASPTKPALDDLTEIEIGEITVPAQGGGSVGYPIIPATTPDASKIFVNTTSFTGFLSTSDVNVLHALQTLDALRDTDTTLAADSDSKIATQKAVKTYIDNSANPMIQGGWNANTNTPNISGTTNVGYAWVVTVAGSTNLGGINSWTIGDTAIKITGGWAKKPAASNQAVWGNIIGTLANQTDVSNAIGAKLAITQNLSDLNNRQTSLNNLFDVAGTGVRGDIYFYNGTNVTRLAGGTTGWVLKTHSSTGDPYWEAMYAYTPQDASKLRTSWQVTPDDTHYPSEKLTKDNLDLKVDKVAGKGLSTNDLTDVLKGNYDTAYTNTHTHSNKIALDNVTNTNTGDETQSTIKTKLGAAATGADGYLTSTDWNTFSGKQAAGSYEVTTNKLSTFQVTPDDTHYPTEKLVKDSLDGKQATGSYELSTNKDTTVTLGTSDVKYPSQKAIKTYADQKTIDMNMYGFLNRSETNIGFDGTNLFTLTDNGAGWSYYRTGLKYTISGNKTVTVATPMVDGTNYYIVIDSTTGALSSSTTAWTLNDTKVPVATIFWNSTLTPKFIMCDERHTCQIDRAYHREHHFTEGSKYVSGGVPSGYTLNSNTDSDKVFAISAGTFADEDLFNIVSALTKPDGATNTYYNMYRTSTTAWTWAISDMPFKYGGTVGAYTYIEYDNGSGVSTASVNNRWVNTYLFISNAQAINEATPGTSTTGMRFIMVQGRGSYSSLALAQGESFGNFDMTGFPFIEGLSLYQLSWNTSGVAAAVKGRCQLAAVTRVTSNIISTSTAVTIAHNATSGIQGGTTSQYYHLTSAEYIGTGTDNFVRQTSPTLTTPTLGVASATTINKVTITAPATGSTLTIQDGFTLTATGNASVTGTNSGNETTTTIGNLIGGSTNKNPIIDADLIAIGDSAASNILKNTTGTNLKAYLKTYNDTLYAALGATGAQWIQTTGTFTARPPSTSTITMTSDLTATIKVGYGLKYVWNSTTYYGIVTAITSNLLTVGGAPLSVSYDVTALYYSDTRNTVQIPLHIAGRYDGAGNDTTALVTQNDQYLTWNQGKAYCVLVKALNKVSDTGATKTKVTPMLNSAAVLTTNSNAGLLLTTAATWYSSVVDINTTNYAISPTQTIDLNVTASTNKLAESLNVSLTFVLE